jgi:hypothetical protein
MGLTKKCHTQTFYYFFGEKSTGKGGENAKRRMKNAQCTTPNAQRGKIFCRG